MAEKKKAPDVVTGIRLEAAAAAANGNHDAAKALLKVADEMDNTKNGSVRRDS